MMALASFPPQDSPFRAASPVEPSDYDDDDNDDDDHWSDELKGRISRDLRGRRHTQKNVLQLEF